MKPRRTHASNCVFYLDGGTEDNDLWIERTFSSEDPDVPVFASVWELTDAERAEVAAGANIELCVFGIHPPVALQTTTVALGKPPSAEEQS